MKSIDIIVLAYNQGEKIGEALASVLNQKIDCTYNVWVSDDCSTDNTLNVIMKFSDRVTIIRNEKNIGASASILNLLEKCKGDYIAFLEGDDKWLDPYKLQIQKNFLETNSDFVACGCDLEYLGKSELKWIRKKRSLSFNKFDGVNLCFQSSTLFMRNVGASYFMKIKDVHKNISDRTIQMILLKHGNLYRLPHKMVLYSVSSPGSVTLKTYKKPNCYFVDLSITMGLSEILVEQYKEKNKFFNLKLVLFGKAYLYYIFGKGKTKTKQTIQQMIKIVGHSFFWIIIAPISIFFALITKLGENIR